VKPGKVWDGPEFETLIRMGRSVSAPALRKTA
jgi:hypothetical protein